MGTATGSFEVTMMPREVSPSEGADAVTRMVLDKTYQGDLDGTGRGQMLASMPDTNGSAGYVALEIFDGELNGKRGSFMLQHSGVMDRGEATLRVMIVPDSATLELAGLSGSLEITNDNGNHTYELSYQYP